MQGQQIGRITTTGHLTEYPVKTAASCPNGIALYGVGPSLLVVFTESLGNNIGVLYPSDGTVEEYPVVTPASCPNGITMGTAANPLIWFTEQCDPANYYANDHIGTFDITTGVVTEYSVSGRGLQPAGITVGLDGSVWYALRSPDEGFIVRATSSGVSGPPCNTPSWESEPTAITFGPDGKVWFTEDAGVAGAVGMADPATFAQTCKMIEYPVSSGAQDITSGPCCAKDCADGLGLWFSEYYGKIGCISTGGIVSEQSVYPASPLGIAIGPDGNIWYTDSGRNVVGRLPAP